MTSKRIGIREAKAQLGRIVREASAGDPWIITDRGRPVAIIGPVPASQLLLADRLDRLTRDGIVEAAKLGRPLTPPLPADNDWAQRYLQEDRGS